MAKTEETQEQQQPLVDPEAEIHYETAQLRVQKNYSGYEQDKESFNS